MINRIRQRLTNRVGLSRIVTILLILILIMAGIAASPYVLHALEDSSRLGCQTALDTARRQMAMDYMLTRGVPTSLGDQDATVYAMSGWDDLCPGGGTVYVWEVKDPGENKLPYELICGLHNPDAKLCTRLNSGYVLSQIKDAVSAEQSKGDPYPESVTVMLHNKELTAYLVDDPTNFRRGTATTKGVDGIVAYYSIVGHSDFGSDSALKDGEVWYFSFADENHCATWSYLRGWTGDSYE